jgi:hypothetical protein
MLATEYLKHLQDLSTRFSHSEAVPEKNKSPLDIMQEAFSPELKKLFVDASRKLRRKFREEAYGIALPENEEGKPYDWMIIVNQLLEYWDAFSNRSGYVVSPRPTFGILPIGSMDAVTIRVPESQEYLIVFNEGLFLYLYQLAKIITVSASSPWVEGDSGVHARIPGICRDKFRELLLRYVMFGKPQNTEQWLLEPNLLGPLQALTTSAEFFLLAHEIQHVGGTSESFPNLKREFHGEEVNSVDMSIEREPMADALATAHTISALVEKLDPGLVWAGIELAVCARELVENAFKLFNNEDAIDRPIFYNVRSLIIEGLLENKLPEHALQLLPFNRLVRSILDSLWQDIRPRFIKLRDSGAAPAKVWSPVG